MQKSQKTSSSKNFVSEAQALELALYIERLKKLHNMWAPETHQKSLIKAMFSDGYKRVFVRGGRKSAKTESILYCAARVSISGKNKVTSVIAPELKQQRKIMWNNRRIHDFFPPSWEGEAREAESRILFPWGSYIELDGAENANSHRGEEQDLLVLDELKDHKTDSYNALYPNLLSRDGILLVVGSPPRDKRNLYYQLESYAITSPMWKCFHWRSWDNTKVSTAWLEAEKAAYYSRGDGDIWESEYEGRYVFGGKKAVFSVFDPAKHVLPSDVIEAILEKDKRHLEYFIVSDPGNRACHANLFIAYNRYNNHVYVLGEIYETRMAETATGKVYPRIQEKAAQLFPDGKINFWIYDEAALWFANEVGAQFPDSPPLCPTSKGTKDKETSMGIIKDCMAAGKLIVSSECVNLIEEITGYYVDDNDKYIKKFDHAIDDLRYFFDFIGYSYQQHPREREETEEEGFVRKHMKGFDEEEGKSLLEESDIIDGVEESFIWN